MSTLLTTHPPDDAIDLDDLYGMTAGDRGDAKHVDGAPVGGPAANGPGANGPAAV